MGKMALLDKETGEIKDLEEGARVLRNKSIEYLAQYQEWNLKHFYKGNVEELRKTLESLSVNEKAFLMSVVTYIGYNDCCLKHDNGRTMDAQDLLVLTRMGKSVLYSTIESLRQKDVIYKGKNSVGWQYFVNPWLFCKGTKVNRVLKTMFKNYKVRVRENKAWGDLKDE